MLATDSDTTERVDEVTVCGAVRGLLPGVGSVLAGVYKPRVRSIPGPSRNPHDYFRPEK